MLCDLTHPRTLRADVLTEMSGEPVSTGTGATYTVAAASVVAPAHLRVARVEIYGPGWHLSARHLHWQITRKMSGRRTVTVFPCRLEVWNNHPEAFLAHVSGLC